MKFDKYLQKQKDREVARQNTMREYLNRVEKLEFPYDANKEDIEDYLRDNHLNCHSSKLGLVIHKQGILGYEIVVQRNYLFFHRFNGYEGDYDDEVIYRMEYLFGRISLWNYLRMRWRDFLYWFDGLDFFALSAFVLIVFFIAFAVLIVTCKLLH